MATYAMAIGKKGKFYIGPADLNTNNRLEISTQSFRLPKFVKAESFDEEIKTRIADFFEDSKQLISIIKSGDADKTIKKIIGENKLDFGEYV